MSAPAAPRPLAGWRVLVTRAREQAASLSALLGARGADVLELPAIEIVAADPAPLDAAIARLSGYDWVIFTSVNGVDAFFDRLVACGLDAAALGGARVGAIGRGTAERLRARGATVAFVPEQFVAESVVEGMVAQGAGGLRVLLPRADIARDTLPDGLRAAGATVDVVVAYRTRRPTEVNAATVARLRGGEIDAVTFASPSTVRNVLELLGGPLPAHVVVACIGPITAQAARERGLRVDVQGQEYSIPGLVEALCAFADSRTRGTAGDVRRDG